MYIFIHNLKYCGIKLAEGRGLLTGRDTHRCLSAPSWKPWAMICTFSFTTWSTVGSNWLTEADRKDAEIHTWRLSAPSWESWAERDFWRWVAFGLCKHIHIHHSHYTADQGVQPSHTQPAAQNMALCEWERPPKKQKTTTTTNKQTTHPKTTHTKLSLCHSSVPYNFYVVRYSLHHTYFTLMPMFFQVLDTKTRQQNS